MCSYEHLQCAGSSGRKFISFHSSVLNETPQAMSCDPNSPSHPTARAGTKRKRGRGGKLHRVWSPSGGRSVVGRW